MKYLCLDYNFCGYSKKIFSSDPITQEMIDNPFVQCEHCSSSMVLVKDDFYFNQQTVQNYEILKITPFSEFIKSFRHKD